MAQDDQTVIRDLLKQDEGPRIDFKSADFRIDTDFNKASLIKDILSMANTPRSGSSYIVTGVAKKLDGSKELLNIVNHIDDANIQSLIGGNVRPIPKVHYRSVSYQGVSLGILEVFPKRGGPFYPTSDYKGLLQHNTIYFRRGSSNSEATGPDLPPILHWMNVPEENSYDPKPIFPVTSIPVGGKSLHLPCFFPSISSVKTNLKMPGYLEILDSVDYPLFLFSAYDYFHSGVKDLKKADRILDKTLKDGKAIIMDSGTFESFWLHDKKWNNQKYWSCLSRNKYNFAFHYDKREQNLAGNNVQKIANEIEGGVLRDQEKADQGTVLPIVHACTDLLPEAALLVVKRLSPVMVAIPERELGEGLLNRAITLFNIRCRLNETGHYFPIHLLGTGNPLSILIYVLCGADSFDGLEWCQTTVQPDTGLLYHFHQRELLGCQCKFCSTKSVPYIQTTLAHNLLFYKTWMEQIQEGLVTTGLQNLVAQYLPKPFVEQLKSSIKGDLRWIAQ
ncbi:MAG: ATP-binding protein [Dehalococcoides mccartyi]|uniref:AlbA family DNA-binding domain-containing protein n=1 Tax=Dehalococcoides mccartyi TaxID=61435 RepID=UPI0030F68844